nr:hypothetical protein [Streptomyces sp. MH191]
MREPHAGGVAVGHQQPQRGRPGDLGLGVLPPGCVQQGGGRAGAGAGHQQGAAGLGGQCLQPVEDEGTQGRRHRQRFPGAGRDRVLGEGAAQLQGEQRVASAGAVDVPHRGAGQRAEAAAGEEFGGLRAGQRADADGEGVRGRGAQETVVLGAARVAPGAGRAQHPDRHVAQAPGGEAEELGARGVQPLQIVGDDQDGAAGGERAQRGQHGEAQREAVALQGGLAAAGQRGLQRGALGGGQTVGHVGRDQAEEVREGEEGQMRLRLGGGAAQHGVRGGRVLGGEGAQDGGLADAGGAVHEDAAAAVELVAGAGEEVLAADEGGGAGSAGFLGLASHGLRLLLLSGRGQS